MPELNDVMNFLHKLVLLVSSLLLASLGSCQLIKYPVCEGVDTFDIKGFQNGILVGNAVVRVRNDNWFSFEGDSLKMDVFYKKKRIALGVGKEMVEFTKKSSVKLPLSITMFADSLQQDLKEILHQDSIQVQVVVSGEFSRLGIAKTAEVDTWIQVAAMSNSMISQSVSEDDLVLKEMKILKTDLSNTHIGLSLNYTNRLPFNVEFRRMKFDIFSDKTFKDKVGYWDKQVGVEVLQGDTALIQGEIVLDNKRAASSGMIKIMTGGSTAVDYYMKGDALIAIDKRELLVPVIVHFEVDIFNNKVKILD